MEPKLTRRQAAIIGAYTGVICGPPGDIVVYVDTLPGFKNFNVWEFKDRTTLQRIRDAARADFMALVPSIIDA